MQDSHLGHHSLEANIDSHERSAYCQNILDRTKYLSSLHSADQTSEHYSSLARDYDNLYLKESMIIPDSVTSYSMSHSNGSPMSLFQPKDADSVANSIGEEDIHKDVESSSAAKNFKNLEGFDPLNLISSDRGSAQMSVRVMSPKPDEDTKLGDSEMRSPVPEEDKGEVKVCKGLKTPAYICTP